ncbi:MAG: RNase adapter RapZ [Desulfobacterales bacterium]|nr:MAG: RNase adapter RapZ [Desulfobacterales bacterium]
MKHLTIIIITGLSGSGKSTAMAVFEDAGFYCVDNMPVALLPKFLELPIESDPEIAGIALVMDLREKGFLSKYTSVFEGLKRHGYHFEILFLEADEQILLQRYSTTRRQHPLSQYKDLLENIRAEKEQLKDLRSAADKIIDTSDFNVHELKAYLIETVKKSKKFGIMQINILSFGFKYGIPHEADLIVDVRFLANPYFIPALKTLDGESQKIKDFIFTKPETGKFLEKYFDLLDYLIPLYEKEGKSYLTIAVGCTGGRHRSVTIARSIFDHIKNARRHVQIFHRDINQPT